ncbi:hypothetical protein [Bacillus sp. JCM 19034]|uniref:hypothetical protein n=1 Tax=Bacillus sp. JCM 19034 TaxID=1481928 RepID=UPI0007863881|nr:hypothetical protein [Bacillus sp. JCM 19034]
MGLDLSGVDPSVFNNLAFNLAILIVVSLILTLLLDQLMRLIRIPRKQIQKVIVIPAVIIFFGTFYVMDKYELFIVL